VSTPRGGEHRGGAQRPEDLGSFDPSLDHLIRALTVSGHPHERVGRDAALAAFRAANERPHDAGLGTGSHAVGQRVPRMRRARGAGRSGQGAAGPSRRPRHLLPARLAAVAAAGFAAIIGVTAAAYAQALPAPVQHIAHSVFAPLGVPNSEQSSGPGTTSSSRSASPSSTGPVSVATATGGTCPCPGRSSPTASAPGAGGYAITVTAASPQVPTGTRDLFTGKVSRRGHQASGVKIRLLERTAGTPGWRLAASGVTGARGRVRLLSPRLATSATFRLAGPSGARSAPVIVTVTGTSPVRLRLVSGKVTDRLIVAAPGASSGAVARLMELVSGAWQPVASKPLGPLLRAVFALPASSAAGHLYRADLESTGSAPVMSKLVWIPRLPSTAAKLIQPSPPAPSTSGATPTPQPTSSTVGTTTPEPPPAPGSPATPDPSTTAGSTPTPTSASNPAFASTPAFASAPEPTAAPAHGHRPRLLAARWDRLPAPRSGAASCARQSFSARDR
jgi:hypothetical protein